MADNVLLRVEEMYRADAAVVAGGVASLDLMEAAPIHGFDTVIEGGADYGITAGSDVTALYIHPSWQEKVEAINQLPDLLGAEPGSVAV